MKTFDSASLKQFHIDSPMPLITVTITVYNIEAYIGKAIESVQNQTYRNLEILLVDDGSKDNSGKICDSYAEKDQRIRVIHKENGGPSEARNLAIEQAKGDYLAFVDGDDWIEPEMYESMLKAMLQTQAELGICAYKEVSAKGIKDPSNDKIIYFQDDEALESFIKEEEEIQIQNAVWNKLFSKKLLKELRLPVGKYYEEILFTTKLLHQAQGIVYLNQAYYNYVIDRAGSIMNQGTGKRIFTDQIPLYMEKRQFLQEIGREDLVQIHNLFFYKRLLLHYMELQKHKPEKYQTMSKELVDLLKKEKVNIKKAYNSPTANTNEKKRMELFLKSPKLYKMLDQINESYLIPNKQVLRNQTEPLVVIQLSGGMGNQMFQYALYLQLKALGKNVKIDDVTEYQTENTRPKRLDVFGIDYPKPTETELKILTDSYVDVASKLRRKITGRKTAEYLETSPIFNPEILQKDRAYLVGCFQSEKYFAEVKEEVKKVFTFVWDCSQKNTGEAAADSGSSLEKGTSAQATTKKQLGLLNPSCEMTTATKKYLVQIQATNAVSVHIRRGDYLEVNDLYGGICTSEYYAKAFRKMRQEVPDCHFFLFTNDPAWAKETYGKEADVTIVEGNDEDHGYLDLYLMTQCNHYILANSSFSWWGAYLSQNTSENKLVLAPPKWFNGRDCKDIYTEEMVKLE